jgi:hypothetical protein
MPPPLEAEVSFAQLTPPLEFEDELDEQPAANKAAAATPATANRYDNLTIAS